MLIMIIYQWLAYMIHGRKIIIILSFPYIAHKYVAHFNVYWYIMYNYNIGLFMIGSLYDSYFPHNINNI